LSALIPACSGPAARHLGGLPRIDKVELLKLEKKGDLWTGEISAQRNVFGDEAGAIASLWRQQSFRSESPMCHFPAYAVKFYVDSELHCYATLCWECDNIEFLTPKTENYVGFDSKGEKGQQLLQIFEKNLP
jgi:hypothetical protein